MHLSVLEGMILVAAGIRTPNAALEASTLVSGEINPLNTKRRLLYLKTQFVPRSKLF